MNESHQSRRRFLAAGAGAAALASSSGLSELFADNPANSRQATGVKVGEVTHNSAIVWTRLTANANHNAAGRLIRQRQALPEGVTVNQLRGACPGAAGRVRVRYSVNGNLRDATTTDWMDVGANTDFTHQFTLNNLRPATVYHYAIDSTGPRGNPEHAFLPGQFETAPAENDYANVSFTVITGQAYKDLDHADGYHIYPAMQRLRPKFIVPTGDTVYYDNDGVLAQNIDLARHHWHRMYGLPRHIEFHRRVPGYWEKDDHDVYFNDCWPTMPARRQMGRFTFAQGLRVYREQVPMSRLPYRTFRWGRGLQVWIMEGRDFRSPNNMPDGPNKTIWGAAQKRWLFQTIQASNATFKVLVSPTPIVGPDRPNKRDNHANRAFQTEGDEIRRWFQRHVPNRFAICCGDRHWQYHSIHPTTRVHEFSCGPVSNQHSGGSPGMDRRYHQFHRQRGGFLSVNFERQGTTNRLHMRLHDVNGRVQYTHTMT